MRRIHLASAAVLIAGAIALLARAAAPTGPAADSNDHLLSIGVVNTTQILRSMQETKKLDADFHQKNVDFAQQQRQKEVELEDLQKHRDQNLKPGSAQWLDETQKIDQKRAEMDVWKAVSNIELERWYKQSIKGVYDHITTAAAQVAQQQHLDLVIADQSPDIGPDLDKVNVGQLQAALAARAVLYSNKKADITQDVLTAVEANFANSNPVPSSAAVVPSH